MAAEFAAAALIDGAAAGDFAQPMQAVFVGAELVPVPVEFEENFLGDLFGGGVILQEVVSDAEDHGLVLADGGFEGAVRVDGRAPEGCMLGQAGGHRCLSWTNTQQAGGANALILCEIWAAAGFLGDGFDACWGCCAGGGDWNCKFEKRSQGSCAFSIELRFGLETSWML